MSDEAELRAAILPADCADTLRFAFAQRPTPEQADWEHLLCGADAAAQVLVERDPSNRYALAWRADRRERIAKARAVIFKLFRIPDTHLTVITNIGGEKANAE